MSTQREKTIRYTLPNLRFRWKDELAPFSDNAIARAYEEFEQSEDFGNNDEKFPEWFNIIQQYHDEDSKPPIGCP